MRAQQAYGMRKGVPWGISESAYFKLDDAGNYQYHAFGLPQLALHKPEINALVISPYSTFLALSVDPEGALQNLRRMSDMGWFGSYGFTSRRTTGPAAVSLAGAPPVGSLLDGSPPGDEFAGAR